MHAPFTFPIRRVAPAARVSIIAAVLALAPAAGPVFASRDSGHSEASVAQLRQATAPFHSLAAAQAAGYGAFYVCTDEPGQGGMGQHFVKGSLVGDGDVDPLQPEALVYRPGSNGYELVAVEYVVFKADWEAKHVGLPSLFGQTFGLIPAPNRFGLPDFYQLHVWVWQPNPSGLFNPWNPRIVCP
jgi:hypothetical protein